MGMKSLNETVHRFTKFDICCITAGDDILPAMETIDLQKKKLKRKYISIYLMSFYSILAFRSVSIMIIKGMVS